MELNHQRIVYKTIILPLNYAGIEGAGYFARLALGALQHSLTPAALLIG